MKNFLSRFLLVGLTLPALFAATVYLPHFGHAAIVLVVLVFSAGCGSELADIFSRRGRKADRLLFAALAVFPSLLLWTARMVFPMEPAVVPGVFVAGYGLAFLAAFLPFAFPSTEADLVATLPDSASRAFPLVYPGLFSASMVLLAGYPRYSSVVLLWFAMIVFGNDSAAWAVGMLLGRHRNIAAVSPNKSLEGFVGAYAGSLSAAFLGTALFPRSISGAPWKIVTLALLVGSAVIAGDLFESALKRSAGVKDSGAAIPGRGGFLDTFDSILFAAPVFYLALAILGLI